jgi:hypothetical protein
MKRPQTTAEPTTAPIARSAIELRREVYAHELVQLLR